MIPDDFDENSIQQQPPRPRRLILRPPQQTVQPPQPQASPSDLTDHERRLLRFIFKINEERREERKVAEANKQLIQKYMFVIEDLQGKLNAKESELRKQQK